MLRAIGSRLSYANVAATGALFLALGGGAYALTGVPDRGGVFHGCVSNSTSVLRVVKSASACQKPKTVRRHGKKVRSPGEFAVAWNQQGRQGIQGNSGQNGQQGQQGTTGSPGVSNYQVVFFGGIVQSTASTASFQPSCPAGKKVLGGGVSIFNANIHVTASSATDDGQSWLVNVQPFSGTTFGGGMGGSAVNIRFVCGTVAA